MKGDLIIKNNQLTFVPSDNGQWETDNFIQLKPVKEVCDISTEGLIKWRDNAIWQIKFEIDQIEFQRAWDKMINYNIEQSVRSSIF